MSGGRVLHFAIGARRFAIPVTGILEIREVPEPTVVPGSPSVIAGLVEIRGRIVTLVDIARVFGMEERALGELLAVQFSEPLAHMGLLVADSAHNVETDPAAEDTWGEEGAEAAEGTPPSAAAEAAEPAPTDEAWDADESGKPLGREIVLSGARPALLLDPVALSEFCTRRVRARFRIAG
jgi:hypothetical protein